MSVYPGNDNNEVCSITQSHPAPKIGRRMLIVNPNHFISQMNEENIKSYVQYLICKLSKITERERKEELIRDNLINWVHVIP